MTRKTILITDDHSLLRKSIVMAINKLDIFDNILEAANGEEAIKICKETKVSLILMDISMPKLDGISASKKLLTFPLPIRPFIIMLSMYKEPTLISNLHKLGIQGYLNKNCAFRRSP